MFTTGSPRSAAIYIGVFTAIITIIFQSLIISKIFDNAWKIILITALATFFITYIIVYYILKKVIIKKIKPIYKIIKNIELNKIDFSNSLDDIDITTTLEKDVETWAKIKTQEIANLKHNEEYRKEFLGNVFHELKTPIFNIQGYISTLIDGGLEDKTINRRFLQKAEKSVDRLISIVEDLNSISNLESGQLKLNKTKFDISELVNEVIELQENRASKKEIKLINNSKKNLFVFADKKLIMQVITNLIINSINYGNIYGTTMINIEDSPNYYIIEISDNGIGIEKENLPRLFERFYRVDKSRSKDTGGTGLGLSICKHIIEAHQQSIYVRSTLHKRTTFSFTLEKYL